MGSVAMRGVKSFRDATFPIGSRMRKVNSTYRITDLYIGHLANDFIARFEVVLINFHAVLCDEKFQQFIH